MARARSRNSRNFLTSHTGISSLRCIFVVYSARFNVFVRSYFFFISLRTLNKCFYSISYRNDVIIFFWNKIFRVCLVCVSLQFKLNFTTGVLDKSIGKTSFQMFYIQESTWHINTFLYCFVDKTMSLTETTTVHIHFDDRLVNTPKNLPGQMNIAERLIDWFFYLSFVQQLIL